MAIIIVSATDTPRSLQAVRDPDSRTALLRAVVYFGLRSRTSIGMTLRLIMTITPGRAPVIGTRSVHGSANGIPYSCKGPLPRPRQGLECTQRGDALARQSCKGRVQARASTGQGDASFLSTDRAAVPLPASAATATVET